MLIEYLENAMKKAKYEFLKEDGLFYGFIPGFRGVYATSENKKTCLKELREVLEEWLFVRLRRNLPIPVIKGINLNLKKVA